MSEKVTLNRIIEELADATGSSNKKSHDFINGLTELVKSEAIREGKASITNFGSFSVVEVSERQGVNPQTGETITIPAHQRLSFTPFKALEKQVNLPYSHLESTVVEEPVKKQVQPEKKPLKRDTYPQTDTGMEPEPETEPVKEVSFLPDPDPGEQQEVETVPSETETNTHSVTEEMKTEPEKTTTYRRPGSYERSSGNTITAFIFIIIIFLVTGGSWWFFFRDQPQSTVAQTSSDTPEFANDPVTSPPEEPIVNQPEVSSPVATQKPVSTPANEESVSAEEAQSSPVATDRMPQETPSQTLTIPSSYQVIGGEWLYDIARKVYGRAALWPMIFDANYSPEQDPDQLQPGPVLVIPALEGSPNDLSEADRAKLAEAIMVVSDAYKQAGKDEAATAYANMANKYRN